MPRPPLGALEEMRCNLWRHAARNFGHRREQGQLSCGIGDGFVGDGRCAGRHQIPGQFRVGRQVKIRENNLPAPQPAAFGAKRFLHFYDELGIREDGFWAGKNFRSGRRIFLVADTGAFAGVGLNQNLVALRGQCPDGRRDQSNPIFIGFDTFGTPSSMERPVTL